MHRESWLDLRALNDFDASDVNKAEKRGDLSLVKMLDSGLFRQAMICAASANDTTRLQERALRDLIATNP